MIPAQKLNTLSELIESALQQTAQLLAVLQSEQLALSEQDYDALEALAVEKFTMSQQIDGIESQQQQLLAELGWCDDEDALHKFLAQDDIADELRPIQSAWLKLLAQLQDCSDQNQINGILMEHHRRRVQSALKLLLNQTGEESLYDAAGHTAQQQTSRTVGVV